MSKCFLISEENYNILFNKLDTAFDEITTLRAQNKALIDALEAVEWAFITGKIDSCPVCHNWNNAAHTANCKLGNALKHARGEK